MPTTLFLNYILSLNIRTLITLHNTIIDNWKVKHYNCYGHIIKFVSGIQLMIELFRFAGAVTKR